MFSRLLRPSTTNAVFAGAGAALTGSAIFATSSRTDSENVSECADNTVVGILQGIQQKVNNIEAVLGTVEKSPPPPKRHGIDIVLGAQWGDEGKGKLVDMLSQVCSGLFCFAFLFLQSCSPVLLSCEIGLIGILFCGYLHLLTFFFYEPNLFT